MKIIIPDDYQDAIRTLDAFRKLDGRDVTIYNDHVDDLDTLASRFHDADVLALIRERTPIRAALLERLPNLKFISQTGRTVPHLDLPACTQHGILVSGGGTASHATAELTWGLVLAAMRFIPQEVARLKAGMWQTTLGIGLYGRTLGIFGYGNIGTVVANYGHTFGMNVLVWGREGSLSRAKEDGYQTVSSQQELFERSDVLSLHVKLLPETRGIVTADTLAHMKPSALLVNTSRAGLIEEGALVAALQAGRPGFAAVDVYETEPLEDHPLLHMDNVICTAHLGYVEKDSYESFFETAFDQIIAFEEGKPINVLNPEVLKQT